MSYEVGPSVWLRGEGRLPLVWWSVVDKTDKILQSGRYNAKLLLKKENDIRSESDLSFHFYPSFPSIKHLHSQKCTLNDESLSTYKLLGLTLFPSYQCAYSASSTVFSFYNRQKAFSLSRWRKVNFCAFSCFR